MRFVGENAHVARSTPSVTRPPSPSSCASGVGEFEITFQCAGAVTVNRKLALRSGCSKTL